jgi:hypothetical protein
MCVLSQIRIIFLRIVECKRFSKFTKCAIKNPLVIFVTLLLIVRIITSNQWPYMYDEARAFIMKPTVKSSQLRTRARPKVAIARKAKPDTSLNKGLNMIPPSIWNSITKKEKAVISDALVKADKFRSAAWDPGAAYVSGVIDALNIFHKQK